MIAALIASGVIFWVSGDISTKTGIAPQFTILDTEAKKVRDVTMTSSPVFNSKATNAKSKAKVPLLTATAYAESA